jgi:tripartite ATP-independent transporter DctM subunit
MSPTLIGLLGLAGLFLLIFIRVPIGIALSITGILGYVSLNGVDPALAVLGTIPFEIGYSYDLSVIPLFVLMGNFAMVSGMSRDLYAFAQSLVGHWRGGLASATIVACAGFAAVSGSSIASAVTMGRVSLPEMKRYNYQPRLATGAVAAGGTLGILIPPSTGFIIYALLTEESVGQLFLAGVIPGILLTLLFMLTIVILTWLRPEIGPAAARVSWAGRGRAAVGSFSLMGIVIVVLGGIYVGIFTPVEAAAVGACLTFALSLIRRTLSWSGLLTTVLETVKTTAMVYLIIIGAFLFNPFLALTQIPGDLAGFVSTLTFHPVIILAIIVLGYVVLGTFLEGLAMMVLTIPIVLPIILNLGYDPVWFGVLMVLVLEMSLISPPLGLNVFVVKGISDGVPMNEIFKGVVPFWVAMLVCTALLIAFPSLALFLPETMIR